MMNSTKVFIISDLLLILSFVVGFFILFFSGISEGNDFIPLLIILVFGLMSFFSKAVFHTISKDFWKSIAFYFLSFFFLVIFFVNLTLMLKS
ncbi:hypothetical protein MUN88_09910 [Gracilibacillus caseinilyticus]|uniref:Uncharacterized protein n=1 Tax=Gracilibacillus caseinilyticus TaxID=2932256 RepID=A0ABY4F1C8_9BACI|nr:hypothetical protein [Gracilibacillus caseinilyticus]UOQ50340.1 hypothetical protein MUN88_09910 [Gracilibacillus caseinilyticus]